MDRDDQCLCYLRVGVPGDQQPQHLLLLPREWLDEPWLDGVVLGTWPGLLHGGSYGISSRRGPAFLLLKGREHSYDGGPGKGSNQRAGFALLQGCQQRLEQVFHGIPCIQIHPDISLWHRQREQPTRNECRLRFLSCEMQGAGMQHHEIDGVEHICGPVKLLAKAVEDLERL